MEETQPPCVIQALPASNNLHSPPKRGTGSIAKTTPSSSRCTRSQAAPDWTVEETLVLVSEIAALDEDWLKALSSYQKWKMISDNCMSLDVMRSSNQCKRRWESLLSDYNKIRNWETRSLPGSYWCLEDEMRKQYRLPASFDQEVFGSMDAVLKAQEARSVSGDSDSEDLIGIPEAKDSDSEYLMVMPESKDCNAVDLIGFEEETMSQTLKSTDKAQEMASKLQENAELIHAILRGELPDNASQVRAPVDLTKPNAIETEFTRRQADELIKAFGVLVGSIDQFTELIKDGQCEGIRPKNSMGS